jgi:hypothetical protein
VAGTVGLSNTRRLLLEYINSPDALPRTQTELSRVVKRSLGQVSKALLQLLDNGQIHRFEAPSMRPTVKAWRYCRLEPPTPEAEAAAVVSGLARVRPKRCVCPAAPSLISWNERRGGWVCKACRRLLVGYDWEQAS